MITVEELAVFAVYCVTAVSLITWSIAKAIRVTRELQAEADADRALDGARELDEAVR
jgi:type II secretory pathway pseudopilin PulG